MKRSNYRKGWARPSRGLTLDRFAARCGAHDDLLTVTGRTPLRRVRARDTRASCDVIILRLPRMYVNRTGARERNITLPSLVQPSVTNSKVWNFLLARNGRINSIVGRINRNLERLPRAIGWNQGSRGKNSGDGCVPMHCTSKNVCKVSFSSVSIANLTDKRSCSHAKPDNAIYRAVYP